MRPSIKGRNFICELDKSYLEANNIKFKHNHAPCTGEMFPIFTKERMDVAFNFIQKVKAAKGSK